ncbi:MAG: hypothetical protein EOP83_11810 [Verrucomicrobiaceae bacterium]|nr:MAG: hypothetical protein EOP83_11810 [Verrucomicrobiaceae bacterium]
MNKATIPGGYHVEFETFETKLRDLGKHFCWLIQEFVIDYGENRIDIAVADDIQGKVLEFLDILATDEKSVLHFYPDGKPAPFRLVFRGLKKTRHRTRYGSRRELGVSVAARSSIPQRDINESTKISELISKHIAISDFGRVHHDLAFTYESVERDGTERADET